MDLSVDMRMSDSPSEAVVTFSGIKGAVERKAGPRYGRPSDHYGPPTALFNQDLAFLEYNLKHPQDITPHPTVVELAFHLITTTTKFFSDENFREEALWPILEGVLGTKGRWQTALSNGSTKLDTVWLEGLFACLIVEMKNEPGLGGDPFLQGLVVYSKFIAQDEVQSLLYQSHSAKLP